MNTPLLLSKDRLLIPLLTFCNKYVYSLAANESCSLRLRITDLLHLLKHTATKAVKANQITNHCKVVQANLDYPESWGFGWKVWIIKSSDNVKYEF